VAWTLAGGVQSVVATDAIAEQQEVVDHGNRNPGLGGMATVAFSIGLHVAERFTGGGNIVMTVAASTEYLGMIYRINRQPGCWKLEMAQLAFITGGNVQQAFTAAINAIVTGNAIANEA